MNTFNSVFCLLCLCLRSYSYKHANAVFLNWWALKGFQMGQRKIKIQKLRVGDNQLTEIKLFFLPGYVLVKINLHFLLHTLLHCVFKLLL
jgi:hypothetical protein